MRIEKLEIKNIGLIKEESIEFNEPLNVFYGKIQQGKTTVLDSVKLCFGGSFSNDLITHGESEALVSVTFSGNMSITRTFYRSDNEIKARQIEFIVDGKLQKKPADAIKTFLNPFLLDQDYFSKMNEPSRRKFFADIFDINTEDLDEELNNVISSASSLRAEIKGFGEVDVTPVEKVDVDGLKEKLDKIRGENHDAKCKAESENELIRKFNDDIKRGNERLKEINEEIKALIVKRDEIEGWLKGKDLKPLVDAIAQDTSDIENQISIAGAQNVRYEQYQRDLQRKDEKQKKIDQLKALERLQKEIQNKKTAKLKDISKTCGIPGLSFTEDGDFIFEETASTMLSTSQEMKLSKLLSGLYPEGFKLSLIDRGESLGESIFDLIDRTDKNENTTLVTVVGDFPAKTPENVGVFVVEGGKVNKRR